MRRTSALILFLLVAVPAAGQERTHDITPDDYASVNTITELAVSPDGKRVAYCLATWDAKADNRRTELWVVDADGKGKPVQLTKDRANERHPKWSGDGKSVYVLANRQKKGAKDAPLDGKSQVWRVPADGGDPVAVTKVKGGVAGYDYAAKADRVFYTVDDTTAPKDEFSALREKFAKPEYSGGKRTVSRLYRIDPDEEKPREIVSNNLYIREFAVTQDGKRVAMVAAPDDTVIRSEGDSRVMVWEGGKIEIPPTGSYRAGAASPWAWLEGLAWNPDGTKFAFCAIFDAYPAQIILGELQPTKSWTTTRMPRPDTMHVRGYGSPLKWTDTNVISYLWDQKGEVGVADYDIRNAGLTVRLAFGTGAVVYAFDWIKYSVGAMRDAKLAVVVGGADKFPELSAVATEKPESHQPLTDLNPQAKSWKLPSVKHITWKAPDGVEVGGPLELPFGWKKGDKPLPLVVAIHGGPTTASYNDVRFDPHNGRLYFAAKGYAVLCPNYRGSTGYGDKFVTDLIGNENDVEVKDIVAGIQHLIKEGIADPNRIAVMGWSNGGYLTNCLISLKDSPVKIGAASSGAGIVDTVAEWGFNDEPAYPRVFKKGLPWETPDVYKKTSPTYQLGNVKTPTLVHVGGDDVRCPPGHSRMLHRALKEYVGVPSELVVYPGEPHGLTKLSNRVAKMEWDLAWFEKYLNKK